MIQRHPTESESSRLKRYVLIATAFWTTVCLVSLVWNLTELARYTSEKARERAREAHSKDVVYRAWSAMMGGVYVPVTENSQPNPYLTVPHRDVTTTTGVRLTLINPAYMTRMVHELQGKRYSIFG
ncbi:MAG: histidine kinase, partial [Deltaproteobacteria bacterium]|nr:histidine kinase [Deltaproteobacteria bacterium]